MTSVPAISWSSQGTSRAAGNKRPVSNQSLEEERAPDRDRAEVGQEAGALAASWPSQ